MCLQMSIPLNLIKKNLYTSQTFQTRFCLCCTSTHKHNSAHQDDPTKPTILNELFQSVLDSFSSLCHMKLQENTDADRSMLDITVTSKGIAKHLYNLNPHKAAGPDQIKPIILKRFRPHCHQNISSKSRLTREPYHQSGRMLMWRLSTKKVNALEITLSTTGPYPLLESQLLMLVGDLSKSVYKKKQPDLILLDFSKAFDKVSHEKLALKLHVYGIRGSALK